MALKGFQAESHNYACIEIENHAALQLFIVNMASGVDRGRALNCDDVAHDDSHTPANKSTEAYNQALKNSDEGLALETSAFESLYGG